MLALLIHDGARDGNRYGRGWRQRLRAPGIDGDLLERRPLRVVEHQVPRQQVVRRCAGGLRRVSG